MRRTLLPRKCRSFRVAGALLSAVTLLGAAASTAPAALLSHWTFDSTSGTDKPFFPDATGNRAAFVADKEKVTVTDEAPFGKAASFNGETGAYLTTKSLPFHKLSCTVAVWIKPSKVGMNFVLTDWESFPRAGYVFGIDPVVHGNDKNYLIADLAGMNARNNRDRARRSVARLATMQDVPPNEWHHVAWVWNRTSTTSGTLTAYLDGREVQSANHVGNANPNGVVDIALNTGDIRIGSRELNNVPFSGIMDELWVFNEALTAEQIVNLMAFNNLPGNGAMTKLVAKSPEGTFVLASTLKPAEPTPATPAPTPAETAIAQANPATPTPTPTPPTTPAETTPPTPAAAPTTPAPPAETTVPPPTPVARNTTPPEPRATPLATPSPTAARPPAPTEARPIPVTPRPMGSEVVARVPSGYSSVRLAGIITCATIALFLAGFLVWAIGERSKLKAHHG